MDVEYNFLNKAQTITSQGVTYSLNEYIGYILNDDKRTELIEHNVKQIKDYKQRVGNIEDMIDVRGLLSKALGTDFNYFYDMLGLVQLDYAHLSVLRDIVKNRPVNYYDNWSKEEILHILNIAFICKATWSFTDTVTNTGKQIYKNGKIHPNIRRESNEFMWGANPNFYERYMQYGFCVDDTQFNVFTFENLYLIEGYAIANLKGISYKEAEQELRNRKNGFFIKDLPIKTECENIIAILKGDFLVLDGELGKLLLQKNNKIMQEQKAEDVMPLSYFHLVIVPLLVKFFGKLIELIEQGIKQNGLEDKVSLIYVNATRINVSISCDLVPLISSFLPYYKSFKRVDKSFLLNFFDKFIQVV